MLEILLVDEGQTGIQLWGEWGKKLSADMPRNMASLDHTHMSHLMESDDRVSL